nr:GAF domain-containing protein [Peterkaempfera griseoplana]
MPEDDTGRAGEEFESDVPRLRLDELLDELQARLAVVRGTHDRVHSLLEAVLSVGRELELGQALHRIVETATVLVDAEYGALGVIGPDGATLSQFVTVGVDEEQAARIGPFPSGRGVLGELIRDPRPLRLPDLAGHPASVGFPAHHPPMHSFLGVPIRVREQVFGNLYLAEKHGGAEFDAEDESLLATLAVAAGVVIDNARLYKESVTRGRWLAAGAEVTRELLSGDPTDKVLALIADRSQALTDADLVAIAVPHGEEELVVELAVGRQADSHRDLVLPMIGSLMGTAYAEAAPAVSTDASCDPRITAGPPRFGGLGPAVAVPIGTAEGGMHGVLLLARATGGPLFTEDETGPLAGFAGQAAVAMELAERRRHAEQIALLEDHDRIARDLHDLAIQRLFATGMTLQSAQPLITHPKAAQRVLQAIDDLDETIRTIRTAIFGLRTPETGIGGSAASLRARAAATVQEAALALGFAPHLRMEGLLDTEVPTVLADHVLAVLAESLANVARHAHAHRTGIVLVAEPEGVSLSVTDDGVGIPEPLNRRGGLRNMAERADQLGGSLEITPAPDGGTRIIWQAPMAGRRRP